MILTSRAQRRTAPGLTGGLFGAWLFAALMLAVPSDASGQFSVYPAVVKVESTDRLSATVFTVENQGRTRLEAAIYLSDYDRDLDGGHTYGEYGTHAHSCAGRLEAFPDQLAVEPGGRGEVRLHLRPGAETCWGIVFVEHRTVTPSGITVAQRIGVKVHAERPGMERSGALAGMVADTMADPAVLLAFENQGEGALEVAGEVEVRSVAGEVLAVVPVARFEVLPGRARRVRVPLGEAGLEPGRYLLVGIVDFGADYLAGAQTLMEIRP